MQSNHPQQPLVTQFNLRTLGNSDLHLTRIGFGAWAIGGTGWSHGWGHQNDQDSIAAIRAAIDSGVNWIDTAAVYGMGHSEEVVAEALRDIPQNDRPYVFTKCVLHWTPDGEVYNVYTPEAIRQECEDSLRRLRVDVIDLYQIHWPPADGNAADIEAAWTTLAELQQAGKVRHIGVSNCNVAQLGLCQRIAPVTSLQPPYSLVDPHVQTDILPYCQQQGVGVINYSPMASGMLTGSMTRERAQSLPADDWRSRHPWFTEPGLTQNLALVDLLREIGEPHGVKPGIVAVAWTLANPAVTAAIVGARTAQQVQELAPALSFTLQPEDKARLDAAIATPRV